MQLPGVTLASCRLGSLVFALTLLSAVAARAQDIGTAVSVVPAVSGTAAGHSAALDAGDGVVRNELIETAAAGTAQLRFVDATGLSIGPSSSVKLDRFVFASEGTAKSFVLNATKGTFRFATGNSNHGAYQILTPAAVIGVRGTEFEFTVLGKRLTLTVFSGTVIVCPLGLSRASCYAVQPGQTVAAQPGRPVTPAAPPRPKATITAQTEVAPPALTWSGCYVGINAGLSWVQNDRTDVSPADPDLALSQRLHNVPRTLSTERTGAAAGGGAGCDLQLTSLVVGAMADIDYTSLRGDTSVTGGPAHVTTALRQSLDFLGTARVRVGLPVGPALVYATGGLAYGDVSTRASIVPPPTVFGQVLAGSASSVEVGWTIGAGAAYAIAQHWSLKVEYLYYDLGENRLTTPTVAGPAPPETGFFRTRTNGSLVRAGADYRF